MREPKNPWKRLLAKLRNSAKCSYQAGSRIHTSKVITITWEQLEEQFNRQNGRCFWLGVKIDPAGIYQPWNHLAPSLDRIHSDKDYEAGNVVITTRFANLGRGRLTFDQFIPQIRKLRKQLEVEMFPTYLFDLPQATPPTYEPAVVDSPQLEFSIDTNPPRYVIKDGEYEEVETPVGAKLIPNPNWITP